MKKRSPSIISSDCITRILESVGEREVAFLGKAISKALPAVEKLESVTEADIPNLADEVNEPVLKTEWI